MAFSGVTSALSAPFQSIQKFENNAMSVGLGIFLGCVFLGSVLLYLRTANSWNWRKLTNRTLIALGVTVGIIVIWFFGYLAYDKWTRRPQVVTSLNGISIGDKLSDVVFKYGELEKVERRLDEVRRFEDEEQYLTKDKRTTVFVRAGIVGSVRYQCERETDYSSMNQIYCGDSGEKIREIFTDKVRVQCSKSAETGAQYVRVYDVAEYGTRYYVVLNKAWGFLVAEEKELRSPVNSNWSECK